MDRTEYNYDEMILLYNPGLVHECGLPGLSMASAGGITHRTIMECDQCAQRWWAYVDRGNFKNNKWSKLRWYHWVLRSKIG